jgi:hypothetical protein
MIKKKKANTIATLKAFKIKGSTKFVLFVMISLLALKDKNN